MTGTADTFEAQRSHLLGIAYRMLGEMGAAEDIVQEAWIRWQRSDEEVRDARAWLSTVTVRLALDALRSARARRERYVGPWLPEPLLPDDTRALTAEAPDTKAELASDLSFALLHLLERLAPEERAAFILHDAFDCDYPQIAAALGKSDVACRKLVSRARERVREGKPRFKVSGDQHRELLSRFSLAVASQNAAELTKILAPDAIAYTDGGGRVAAALLPIYGAAKITRFIIGISRKFHRRLGLEALPLEINGRPGIVMLSAKDIYMAITLETDGERITAVYGMRNPEKLERMASLLSLQNSS
jgi:RNA polymerase sigma-70 factor (ECF subfamily)